MGATKGAAVLPRAQGIGGRLAWRVGGLTALVAAMLSMSGCKEAQGEGLGLSKTGSDVALSLDEVRAAGIVVEPASEQEIDDTLVTSGRVTFEDVRVGHVFSPVTGRVARIDVLLGQRVKAGQPLAVIQSPDLGQWTSDVAKADADLIAAEHDLQREKDLLDKNATSHKDYEAAEDAYRQARAEKQRALQKAYMLRAGGVDTVTQGFVLVAPLDGEVIARNLSVGTEVQGQYSGGTQELFTVGELDEVWVMADLYEIDLARVQTGAKCIVRTVAYRDKPIEGKVDWISSMLDPSTRTAKVRCTFANPDHLLKPDMYATATISVASRKALALPRGQPQERGKRAVLHLGTQTVVFLDHGPAASDAKHHFERVPVAVDEDLGGRWLPVLHGLKLGDNVVTQGADTLQDKM
jgi:cobalt-zinc-cadmium efflux system membrane fusion protein